MNIKSLISALQDASTHDRARHELDLVRLETREAAVSWLGAARTIVVVCVSFELLARTAVSEATIVGVKLGDLSLVTRALPVIVAFTWVRALAEWGRMTALIDLYQQAYRVLYPQLYRGGWNQFGVPSAIAADFLSVGDLDNRSELLFWVLMIAAFLVVMLVGPVGFLVYSYWFCFRAFGSKDVLVWFSVALTTMFSLQALLYLLSQVKREQKRGVGSSAV